MTPKLNSVIGAIVRKDGKLDPVEGEDPSSPRTYRVEPQPQVSPENEKTN